MLARAHKPKGLTYIAAPVGHVASPRAIREKNASGRASLNVRQQRVSLTPFWRTPTFEINKLAKMPPAVGVLFSATVFARAPAAVAIASCGRTIVGTGGSRVADGPSDGVAHCAATAGRIAHCACRTTTRIRCSHTTPNHSCFPYVDEPPKL